ncbi:conserved hypothetical protein [Hyella patelloides LEGE 07179]|uniref:NUMOD4 domain-containing protein n=1 Tax=Hyella patelloides LEGE 07179 TaxID=945734 RepID=A0A563VPS1_9CYAN|nr:NUMOD4 domain-containing protein [Hyella patelloides]VEP13401.1 conserved hypothetical protein [Hyella patelloides LEGE 07179]
MNYRNEDQEIAANEEKWVAISGYEGVYQVSDRGRIRSLDRFINNQNGELQIIPGKLLKLHSDRNNYLQVYLCRNSQVQMKGVHHLVAKAFLPPPKGEIGSKLDSYCLNHMDGHKHNNCADNLEWITNAENHQHAIDNGLFNSHGSQTNSKLTEAQVLEIWELLQEQRLSARQIALCFDVSTKTIQKIKYGKTWSKVTGYIANSTAKIRRYRTKLTAEQVKEIKVLLRERKFSIREIAELYDVSKWTIRDIKRGHSWRDIL